ncbi:thermonuclease family protein [Acinetobacter baumannii]
MKINLIFIPIAFMCVSAHADFKGSVIAVRDGGSVIVNSDGQDILVKLNSIVTPYPNQNLYSQSRIVYERIFLGRTVNVVTNNNPNSGCVHGELLSDGVNLNEALLMTGYAWVFDKKNAPARYKLIEENNQKNQVGLFNPDHHFQFNALSLTSSYFFKECLASSAKVPISEQYNFVAERDKYGFTYSVRSIFIGVVLGFMLLWGLFYFDRLGIDLDLSKHIKYFKRDKNDVDKFK